MVISADGSRKKWACTVFMMVSRSSVLKIDGVPFFDPDKGYVSSGDPEVREKYYSEILKAMLEGTISREEWEEIVATYFADLKDKEENKEV